MPYREANWCLPSWLPLTAAGAIYVSGGVASAVLRAVPDSEVGSRGRRGRVRGSGVRHGQPEDCQHARDQEFGPIQALMPEKVHKPEITGARGRWVQDSPLRLTESRTGDCRTGVLRGAGTGGEMAALVAALSLRC